MSVFLVSTVSRALNIQGLKSGKVLTEKTTNMLSRLTSQNKLPKLVLKELNDDERIDFTMR